MGQGEEVKTRSEPQVEIQEKGEIFFFYRPKVDREEAHSPDDVQRLYIVLQPESGERTVEQKQNSESGKEGAKNSSGKGRGGGFEQEDKDEGGHGSQEVNIEKEPLLRFIVMGRKCLPDPRKRSQPYWGFVDLVTTKIDDVKSALKGEEYDTSTRGHRHQPPARAMGEGVYRIVRHNPSKRMHTHLIYKLEFPPKDKEDEPQDVGMSCFVKPAVLKLAEDLTLAIKLKKKKKASIGLKPPRLIKKIELLILGIIQKAMYSRNKVLEFEDQEEKELKEFEGN